LNPLQLLTRAIGPYADIPTVGLRLAIGLLVSAVIALLAYRRQSLSQSGAWGAVLIGTIIFGLGGLPWGLLLIAFFVTSSIFTHYQQRRKEALADHAAKTGRRDLGQVLANGGIGALLAAAFALTGGNQIIFFFAFVGAMAAVTADTWATELGVLSPEKPRLITTGERVERGSSGGVSSLGLAAAVAGAWAISFLGFALVLGQYALTGDLLTLRVVWLPLLAALGGVAGSLVDSLLGATVQCTYYCPQCGKETEQPIHRCGRQPIHIRGWHWLDNDWVNVAASLTGVLVTVLLGALVLYL